MRIAGSQSGSHRGSVRDVFHDVRSVGDDNIAPDAHAEVDSNAHSYQRILADFNAARQDGPGR